MADITIEAGVTSTGLTVNSGDTLHVYGAADQTTIAGGQMRVSAGGLVTSTNVDEGSLVITAGGSATDMTVAPGAFIRVYNGATADRIVENGGNVIVDNAPDAIFAPNTFSNLTLGNGVSTTVHSGTVADSTTVNKGATMNIYSSGLANDTVVNGGYQNVYEGGVAERTTIAAGGLRVLGGVANNAVLQGGALSVSGGGIANSATASAGTINVQNGGLIENTTADYANDWDNDITIEAGGSATGTTLKNGVRTVVYGTMTDTTINLNEYGQLLVSTGGIINDTKLESGANPLKILGGTANSTTVNAGMTMNISEGGVANSTTLTGANAKLNVYSGCVANDTIVNAGGVLDVYDNGLTNNTLLEGQDAKIHIYGSGTINSTTLQEGAAVYVYGNGVASATTVNSGGMLCICNNSGLGTAYGTILNGGTLDVQTSCTVTDTVVNSGSMVLSRTAKADNLTLLQGGVLTIANTGTVTGGTIGGEVAIGSDSPLNDVIFTAGADVYYSTFHFIQVDNADANAEGFSSNASFDFNGSFCKIVCQDDLFLNGNTVSTLYTAWNCGTDGNLYAGKAYGNDDNDEYDGVSNLTIDTSVNPCTNYIYGGGKVEGACTATITGNSLVTLKSASAARAYAGYEVLGTTDTDLTLNGNSALNITGGTFDYIRGGVVKSESAGAAVTVNGNATTNFSANNAKSIVGDYQVGAGASFDRTGNTSVTITGGTVTGSVVGAGVSYGGAYELKGDSALTITGGTLKGNIYGGITVGTTGAIDISKTCRIDGNTSITIDNKAKNLTIGEEGKLTSIFVGSYAMGEVTGTGTLTIKNVASSNLNLLGTVEFIGDSSGATTKNSYVGDSKLVFDNARGFLNVMNIAGFDTVELTNNSQVGFNNLMVDGLVDVSTWNFEATTNNTLSMQIGGTSFVDAEALDNFFKDDTINVTFNAEDYTAGNANTLINDVNGLLNLSSGLEYANVFFNGVAVDWDAAHDCFTDGQFVLRASSNGTQLKFSVIA